MEALYQLSYRGNHERVNPRRLESLRINTDDPQPLERYLCTYEGPFSQTRRCCRNR